MEALKKPIDKKQQNALSFFYLVETLFVLFRHHEADQSTYSNDEWKEEDEEKETERERKGSKGTPPFRFSKRAVT